MLKGYDCTHCHDTLKLLSLRFLCNFIDMQQTLNLLLILFMSALLSAVQASIAANTWVVTGASQTKSKSSV
jgi:hypothetical protein